MTRLTLKSAHDGFSLPALRKPARGDVRGGVVVLQEIFGVTAHIAQMTKLFADAGYDAIAPSMYDRVEADFLTDHSPEGFAKGRAAAEATHWDQVVADVQAAIDALPKPCYVVGFCWGGAAAWAAAARCSGVAAAASFYGRLIPDITENVRAPTMLHYGARDAAILPANYESVRTRVPLSPLYLYDAGHGFCREGSADYDKTAADLALSRTIDWFARWR